MFKYSSFVTLTLIIVLGAVAETSPVDILQSEATLEEKAEACRLISISGDVNAIPVLEPLLADAELSHYARYALEPMETLEADAALRRALQTTSDSLKAGVIASLGVRRDATAVPELISLLNDENGFIVEAAARSLGRIAEPEGVEALKNAVAQPDLAYATIQALADGLFFAAEHALANDNDAGAIPLYDKLYALEPLPIHLRAAAFRGAVLARRPQEGLPLLLTAITGEDAAFFTAALRIALEMKPKGTASGSIERVLPTLAEDRKIQVMQTLGELGRNSAGRVLMKEFQTAGDIQLRIAALRAAVRLAYKPVLPVLAVLISSDDVALAKAAKEGLSYFPGKEGDEVIKDMLKSGDVQLRLTAVELISQGAVPDPVVLLMQTADEDAEDAVRVAALKGAKEYVGMPQMAGLLVHLLEPKSHDEMIAAEEAIKLLCIHEKTLSKGDIVITKAVYGDLPEGPQADVTEKVAQLVSTGVLAVDAHNGNFGDTAPDKVKQLRVDYTDNGSPASQTVQEGQTLRLGAALVPAEIIDALCNAFATSEGESKLAIMRVLTSTGDQKAYDAVLALASTGEEGELKETAVRAVCDWPTVIALPTLMGWVNTSQDNASKMLALRGAVRLLMLGQDTAEGLTQQYATLLAQAASPNEKKLILSGLAKIGHASALTLVLEQLADEAVKAEAVQAAITIAEKLGASPQDAEVLEKAKALIPEISAGGGK